MPNVLAELPPAAALPPDPMVALDPDGVEELAPLPVLVADAPPDGAVDCAAPVATEPASSMTESAQRESTAKPPSKNPA